MLRTTALAAWVPIGFAAGLGGVRLIRRVRHAVHVSLRLLHLGSKVVDAHFAHRAHGRQLIRQLRCVDRARGKGTGRYTIGYVLPREETDRIGRIELASLQELVAAASARCDAADSVSHGSP